MKKYTSIYKNAHLKQLLKQYREGDVSSDDLLSEISTIRFQEMSISKNVKLAFPDLEKYPKGGIWLKKLVDGFRPIFLSYLSMTDNKSISFKDYIEDNQHRFKDFNVYFPTNEDKEKFWKIIQLISDELED